MCDYIYWNIQCTVVENEKSASKQEGRRSLGNETQVVQQGGGMVGDVRGNGVCQLGTCNLLAGCSMLQEGVCCRNEE